MNAIVDVQARPILMRAVEGGDYNELVDPHLQDNYDPDEMLRMVACAAACIRHSARRRPKMSQVQKNPNTTDSSIALLMSNIFIFFKLSDCVYKQNRLFVH